MPAAPEPPAPQEPDMNEPISRSLVVLGASLLLGLIALGWLLGNYAVRVKKFDRTVVVKGLSEREVPADIAIWPLTFQDASNDLNSLFTSLQKKNALITEFLVGHGIAKDAITVGAPGVTDRLAQSYGDTGNIAYRYTATSTVTVYTNDVEAVRKAMRDVIALGQKGVALSGEGYQGQMQLTASRRGAAASRCSSAARAARAPSGSARRSAGAAATCPNLRPKPPVISRALTGLGAAPRVWKTRPSVHSSDWTSPKLLG